MIVKSELILVSALLVNQIITSVGTREKVEVSNINSIAVFLYCIWAGGLFSCFCLWMTMCIERFGEIIEYRLLIFV